mmetsp:Transcript_4749/g.9071  ORF Transcript_4749/g.9071 Transcript_4749/m.9071 type:complete len:472 (+) Transcript_4749:77-1492(+)
MGKKGKSKAPSGDKWDHDRHTQRLSKKIDKQKERDGTDTADTHKGVKGYHRSMLLSHDNFEKRQEGRLRLHISKAKREVDALRKRLEAWDDVSERENYKMQREEEEKKRKREEEECAPGFKRKRKGRLGPETWKLRGAARPAWEVYDFDTRYADPHVKAHQEALERAKRSVNAFHVCKGMFGKEIDDEGNKISHSPLMIEICRKFLSLSMQLALLSLEAKKFKSAREILLEIIQLEGTTTLHPITNARCRLMRMYLDANRPESARRLWEKLPTNYSSVWVRYSAALLEFVSWKILKEEGSSQESAEALLVTAIRANLYCAYYISFHETFQQVMEYTDEVEDAADGTLEQAIEYCNSEEMGNWIGTEGAVSWIKNFVVRVLKDSSKDCGVSGLKKEDLEWEEKLATLEREYDEESGKTVQKIEDRQISVVEPREYESDEDVASQHSEVDLLMYIGMFRTGMDMLSDAGEFAR